MIDLDELERKAKAATAGNWSYSEAIIDRSFCAQVWDFEDMSLATLSVTEQASRDAEFIAAFNPSVAQELILRLRDAEQDGRRIDWLADLNNNIGNVQLPAECVLNNLHSLRAAIDEAMKT